MFDHVLIRVADLDASRRFYDTVLAPLGHPAAGAGGMAWWGEFGVVPGREFVTRGLHVGFVAQSREEVDAFWREGVGAGYANDGEPGVRLQYHDQYYGGFLLDPDGNSVEAVFHGHEREAGNALDHLWLRVADLDGSQRFFEAIAPSLGLGVRRSDRAVRVHVEQGDRSFALVPGDQPTEQVHLAFPVADNAAVDAFHAAALEAGYRDNGAPGERSYHPGYYAAFVLDPDGNNIEAVNHNRG